MEDSRALHELEEALGYKFKDLKLITEALTHRSHHYEFGDSSHNERLEFLGDSILDLCVSEIVMKLFPKENEGYLSKLRSHLVSEMYLAEAAQRIGLGAFIRLGKGEDQSGGRTRTALLSDSLEAVFAAIYTEGGLEPVRIVIQEVLQLKNSTSESRLNQAFIDERDFKSRLQELTQSLGFEAPVYICTGSCGPDHARNFTMALSVQGVHLVSADAKTKKEATQAAASKIIQKVKDLEGLLKFFSEHGIKARRLQKMNENSHE